MRSGLRSLVVGVLVLGSLAAWGLGGASNSALWVSALVCVGLLLIALVGVPIREATRDDA